MITAITPTGDRPLAFALCQNWMFHQTVKLDQWVVVDDGKVPTKPFVPMDYIRREPQPDDPRHTLLLNLKTAVPVIKGDKILIIEDDEYYAPNYVQEMAIRLNRYEVVGVKNSKYYHLPSGGYCTHANMAHASLAQTGFRSSFLPTLSKLLENPDRSYLDVQIWRNAGGVIHDRASIQGLTRNRRGLLFIDNPPLYLGIKGLPGRPGIGIGHTENRYAQFDGPDRAILKKWVPKDYQIYLDIINGKPTGEQSEFHPEI
jgi:hypothetical protein